MKEEQLMFHFLDALLFPRCGVAPAMTLVLAVCCQCDLSVWLAVICDWWEF